MIALTGGIGAGKSVVANILRVTGHHVFDCDSEARALMDGDRGIKERLATEIAAEVVCGDIIDRRRLAEIVFADMEKLRILNDIVHGAVKERITRWAAENPAERRFIETAIMYESGLNRLVDKEWRVTAPTELRIERVMRRNGMSRPEVERRIASQSNEAPAGEPEPELSIIVNDGTTALLPQIFGLLV